METLTAWLTGRLPDDWFDGAPEVTVDKEEITIVGRLAPPDLTEVGDAPAHRAAEVGRIKRFREDTRERRMQIDAEAQHHFGRSIAWGASCGDTRQVFTNLSIPVMTRLRQPDRVVLDTLVDAGVARSRSDALAWCVRLVGQHETDWLQSMKVALVGVQDARNAGPTNPGPTNVELCTGRRRPQRAATADGRGPPPPNVPPVDLPIAVTQARRVLRRRLAWHRRPLAAGCVALTVLAGFTEVRAMQHGVNAVVAARDLPAGAVLTAHDLTTVTLPAQSLADGAVPTVADAVGERLTLPMRRNEPVTGVRLVSGGLLQALGHGLRAVPVRLADAALAEVLQTGSVVDVYARNDGGASLGAVATAVTILRLLPADDQGVVVLIAADDATAARLTAAAGGGALSVALRAPP